MDLRATLVCLYWLAVLSSSAAQDETAECRSQTKLWQDLAANVKVAVECGESQAYNGDAGQTAELLLYMRNLTDSLHKHQLQECQGAEPASCPAAEVPSNGGLACVTVANKRYCKPLCNHGYDFSFLRRTRLFDECSEQTGYKWQSQYVGGNTLAVCNEASVQVSGAETAYFTKDCLTTKISSQLKESTMASFTSELRKQGIQGELQHPCLVCG
ncbi:uncharacterized protein si:ch1073-126c3.2 [Mugil cephalus]|uniref:uncharacterized protein si:ch1073-126c3.2 n=1 Tax=Mugil cephalus TaxID=48193 RepID=UPI001FB7A99F|nr:uncharacterized protein si:ch1073-126c3.2 [Mugil cephalus]